MIIQYFTAEGRCLIEKTRLSARYLEMRDGDHPITNDSVWQDDKRIRQPILVIHEGCLGPFGADMTEEDIISIMTEIELIKLSYKHPSVSKMWMRGMGRMFEWFWSRGVMLLIFGMIAYFVLQSILEGQGV